MRNFPILDVKKLKKNQLLYHFFYFFFILMTYLRIETLIDQVLHWFVNWFPDPHDLFLEFPIAKFLWRFLAGVNRLKEKLQCIFFNCTIYEYNNQSANYYLLSFARINGLNIFSLSTYILWFLLKSHIK